MNKEEILLMNRERIERSVGRMAYQIAEDNPEASKTLIIGLKERGFAVAQLLKKKLSSLLKNEISLLQLQLKANSKSVFNDINTENGETGYSYILLVDDVIFSGRTMLAAIQKIPQKYTISRLRTVVLVDRGHRVVPVEATFTGLTLPTKLNERVTVQISKEIPGKVILINKQG